METLQPKLRFPEFKGNWQIKKLKEIGSFLGGGTPSTKEKSFWDGDIPWISSSDVSDDNIFDIRMTRFISSNAISKSATKLIPKGSILIVSRVGVGKVVINKVDLCTSQDFTNLILENSSNLFIAYLIKNETNKLLEFNQGTSIKGFVKSDLEDLRLNLPSLPEQIRIADFLSAVDEKLHLLKEKKALLEEYKKGMMQKIFNQELRFKDDNGEEFGDWKEKVLGDLCKITTGKLDANAMVENGQYRFYTCAKDYYKIDKFAFDTEALLISGNGANVGYIHYYNGKFNAYQRTYILDGFEENIIFVKYYLQMNLPRRIKGEKNDGNTPYIVIGTLSEMDFLIPHYDEQTKIAQFLSAIDDKIGLVGNQIEETVEYKKGLLQGMFV